MWGIAAGVGTLLGTVFGLGLIGIWIGIAADELIRGVVMHFRWQSGAWVSKRMVDDVLPPDALLEEQTAVV
jgi:Na+-driven multidrug efflux pump